MPPWCASPYALLTCFTAFAGIPHLPHPVAHHPRSRETANSHLRLPPHGRQPTHPKHIRNMIHVGITGGDGYAAGELIRLLINHPDTEIAFVHSTRHAGRRVDSPPPRTEGRDRPRLHRPAASRRGRRTLPLRPPHGLGPPGHGPRPAPRAAADRPLARLPPGPGRRGLRLRPARAEPPRHPAKPCTRPAPARWPPACCWDCCPWPRTCCWAPT